MSQVRVDVARNFYATFCKARDEAGLTREAKLADLIEHHRVEAASMVAALIQRNRGLPADALDVYGDSL